MVEESRDWVARVCVLCLYLGGYGNAFCGYNLDSNGHSCGPYRGCTSYHRGDDMKPDEIRALCDELEELLSTQGINFAAMAPRPVKQLLPLVRQLLQENEQLRILVEFCAKESWTHSDFKENGLYNYHDWWEQSLTKRGLENDN